jgi:predicted lipid-binding transport protein (Tim44 family)
LPMLLVVLVVVGAGGGVAMLAFDGARSANATHRAGAASGVVNMGGFSGAVLIELVVGLVLQMARGLPAGEAYRWAFLPVIAVLAAGVFAQMALRTPRDSGRSSASLARPLGETDRVGDRR